MELSTSHSAAHSTLAALVFLFFSTTLKVGCQVIQNGRCSTIPRITLPHVSSVAGFCAEGTYSSVGLYFSPCICGSIPLHETHTILGLSLRHSTERQIPGGRGFFKKPRHSVWCGPHSSKSLGVVPFLILSLSGALSSTKNPWPA
ncbi:hypothetical protein IWX50DRAFT_301877 [Phyllosticta citricarpa]